MIASASISTSMSGETSAATCTIEQAGRISPKTVAVRAAHGLPLTDVGDEDARADDVHEARAGLFEGHGDVRQRLSRLGGRVADADDLPSGPKAVVPET